MSNAQVNVNNSLDVMTQLNPEIMNKYTDVAGNSLNYEWNSNRKLTLYFADTIGINNYDDIREFAHSPRGFAPGVYLQGVEAGTYYIVGKVYQGSYVDKSKIEVSQVEVYQDRNMNNRVDHMENWHECRNFHMRDTTDRYGNLIEVWTGHTCNLNAAQYYRGEYSWVTDDGQVPSLTASSDSRPVILGEQYYNHVGVSIPRVKTSTNTTTSVVTKGIGYEWCPSLGEELVDKSIS